MPGIGATPIGFAAKVDVGEADVARNMRDADSGEFADSGEKSENKDEMEYDDERDDLGVEWEVSFHHCRYSRNPHAQCMIKWSYIGYPENRKASSKSGRTVCTCTHFILNAHSRN